MRQMARGSQGGRPQHKRSGSHSIVHVTRGCHDIARY
jgi:hypothetical protein